MMRPWATKQPHAGHVSRAATFDHKHDMKGRWTDTECTPAPPTRRRGVASTAKASMHDGTNVAPTLRLNIGKRGTGQADAGHVRCAATRDHRHDFN